MTFRTTIVRCRLAAPVACMVIATVLPYSAVAEQGIPAGSGAVVTAGQPLTVRATPGWDAEVSYEIADGSYVTVWDAAQVAPDGSLWYPVDGGFVPVDAVTSVASLTGGVALSQDATHNASTGALVESATADAAGADLTATDQETAAAPINEWVDPATGQWVEGAPEKESVALLPGDVVAEPAPAEVRAEPALGNGVSTDGAESPGEPIALAYLAGTGGEGAPCFATPQWGTETLAVLAESQPVEIRAESSGEWQPVNCAGAGGYVHTSLIAWEPSASSAESIDLEQEAGKRNGASGNDIVDFAMRYEGHPYVDAGEGPKAFDCSGFTMFVINRTLGIDIPHDMAVQYEMGNPVNRKALQPGDLIFFKNTFRRGLSHTGIYIGGGQFIHAENESTGVRVSELDSEYYSSRWYGAVRFA